MARPKKPGLSYFPFECDFFHDRKIRNLRGRYGNDGICVYQYLLCEIYIDNGYYVVWDEDLEDAMITDLGLKDNFINQVLNYLCNRSLFDNTLFTSVKVLTSESIQRRYQSAKGANSNPVSVDADKWLLNEKETLSCIKVTPKTDLSEKNGSFSEINTCLTEKNTLKESKVNKRKINESSSSKPTKRFAAATSEETDNLNLSFDNIEQLEILYPELDWEAYEEDDFLIRPVNLYAGKKVVFLSKVQEEMLYAKLGIEATGYYVERLADFIIDNNAKVKNHFATILKWHKEDSRL